MPENEVAGVAELPAASDFNGCDSSDATIKTAETPANPQECRTSRDAQEAKFSALLQEAKRAIEGKQDEVRLEVDQRLITALYDAGRSALGMPSTVDTFKAMLAQAGLKLVLA